MNTPNQQSGFTLIELSIVLVIIGLIVGGVLMGRDLIKAAEIREAISQVESFKVAVKTFRLQYNALPGDMPTATQIWGAANADPATCIGTIGSGTETCDGDGNDALNISTGSHESARFWQHLANANLVKGTYTGIDGGGPVGIGCQNDGSNCPQGVFGNSYYEANTTQGTGSYTPHAMSNFFLFGNSRLAAGQNNDTPIGAIMTTQEAFQIDSKIDDGKPVTGKAFSTIRKGAFGGVFADVQDCSNNADPSIAEYDLTRTEKSCSMKFLW